ncbi:MAG: RNA polymerase sigma factor [Proteobacteria bacterium]|nr:RNA polymerase sigma factor [Pseudomonadota bacterium]
MLSDEALVSALARGEQRALGELMLRYEHRLPAFIYRQTGGRDVDDIYQETWLRVLRGAKVFDSSRRFSTWLFQLAVNLCRDHHRRRVVQDRGENQARDQAAVPVPQTSNELSAIDRRLDAQTLLGLLDERHREVVLLRCFEDMSEEQAARVLSIPRGTVKSRMHNAIVRMAAVTKGEPG